ncbi:hypothetical protein JW968_06150 [Candidatus Woesearchaeota archaeon]|nr:hypothetical protein [Candidatus Woesearchaeota archaeon]
MSERLKQRLRSRGWSEDEITKIHSTLYSEANHIKHEKFHHHSSKMLYWITLLVLLICNFAVSLFIVPFLLVLSTFFLYAVLAALGLVFGFLFNLLITDIEHLERRHHLFAAIFMPVVSIVNVFVMIHISNVIAGFFKVFIVHDPFTLSIVYVAAFLAPYLTVNYEILLVRKFGIGTEQEKEKILEQGYQ